MDYISEIKILPPDIQDILMSSFGAKINREIGKKHNLDNKQLGQIIDLTNDVYLKVLDINNLKDKIIKTLDLPPNKAQLLSLDIAGLKLLIADNYFAGAIKNFITASNGSLDEYRKIVVKEEEIKKEQEIYKTETEEKIYTPKFVDLSDAADDLKFANQEKLDAVALFKEDIKNVLTAKPESTEIIAIYNESLIDLIKEDNNFRRELETALYHNQEIITPGKITLNDSEVSPTISNWLKDFISENSSEVFSNVVLVKYITNNRNVKKLKESERELIKKLLKLYRNLVFFPESMENVPLEEWEIFPIDLPTSPAKLKMVDVLDEDNDNLPTSSATPVAPAAPITPAVAAPKSVATVF
ncbi:MAG: hypothetical protein NTX66_03260 [Candidatus Falkowbacteria bacterium]|nr:hypothetical protein [Candidatus Falkowbacteria bacterium]